MAEYIERNKVIEFIKNYGKGAISDGIQTLDPIDDIVMLVKGIDLLPTADVVEVVRCKDCKYGDDTTYGFLCNLITVDDKRLYMKANYFCCFGERKDGK